MTAKRKIIISSLAGLVLLSLIGAAAIYSLDAEKEKPLVQQIKDSGELTVITRNNANCYYYYRGQPRGFEYDLAKAFSRYIEVDLKTRTEDWSDMFKAVNQGKGDFIAAGVTITRDRQEQVSFSDPYMKVQQQVIVHRNNRRIESIEDLNGTQVHVRKGTTYEQRLRELNQQKNLKINIILYEDIPTEELIREVAEKEIDITVADSNIALLNRRYYPDIKIAFPIEEEQTIGWVVSKDDQELLQKINAFFEQIKENGKYGQIYERYYGNVHIFDYVDLKKFHRRLNTRLPKYKEIIKKTAGKHGFDWRLIAAVIYQESHFDPKAISFSGVKGLMQVTLATAKEMGIDNRLDPRQSVQAGVRYLKKMYSRWEEIDGRDRLLFALASYNIGYGHVRDAQTIAEKKGLNPNKWESMEKALPLLRNKKYYKNTKYGYARGTEPVRFVDRIFTYYDILKNKNIS